MGTMMGNILSIVLVIIIALTGFISLQFSAIAFLVVIYGIWVLCFAYNFSLGRLISSELETQLSQNELRVFRNYNIHIRGPAFGELVSAFLNLFGFAGFMWAGFCVWQELYVLGALAVGFYFLSGGLILRTNPFLYMSDAAKGGNQLAINELELIENVSYVRNRYLKNLPD
jgi:hypothetical protein